MRIEKIIKRFSYLMIAMPLLFSQCKEPAEHTALIVSDQDAKVGESLKTILEKTGLFDADVTESNAPDFEGYDAIIIDVNKAEWSDETKEEFMAYLNNGGGAVLLGASPFAFGEWEALSELTGLAGGEVAKSDNPYKISVINENGDHPVTRGLHRNWMHDEDYMIFNTGTLGGNAEVLSVAWADSLHGGPGKYIPAIIASSEGQGRLLCTTFGSGASKDNEKPLQCAGFITILQRGAEWAATGKVTQAVPVEFPTIYSTYEWENFEPLSDSEILKRAATYKIGKSTRYLRDFSLRIRSSDGKPETLAKYEDMILTFLNSDASVDSKKYMCKELSWMGSEKSIPVLEKLVNDKELSEAASYALQRLR